METKYKIMIGAGIGAIAGGLLGFLKRNKTSQNSPDLDNLTAESLIDETEPISELFDNYKGIKHYGVAGRNN